MNSQKTLLGQSGGMSSNPSQEAVERNSLAVYQLVLGAFTARAWV